jgi:D-alanyl-D-alanine carboxypeptidase
MKKILILTILPLVFLSFGTKTVYALDTSSMIINLNQQIQDLQKKIQDLMSLFSNTRIPETKTINGIAGDSYIAVDLSNNSVILEKNIDKSYTIASITKLMNSVVTLENINLAQTITLKEKMLEPVGYSPSLFLGLNVSAENLLKASLIQSTNDAAESLTYFLDEGEFLKLMNKKAEEIGMTNTHYYDVHGLNPQNHSTASDLVKLLNYINKNHPKILAITKDNNFWLPNPVGRLLKFANLNGFFGSSEFIGGKSGYLPEAKHSFASLFNIKGKTYAIVVLCSDKSKTDTSKIVDWIKKR